MENIPETIPEVNDETSGEETTPRKEITPQMGTTMDLSDKYEVPTVDGLNQTASQAASTPLEVGREDSLLALSLSLQKLVKAAEDDAEDEESEGSDSGSDGSESESDSAEALDERTEQPRSDTEKFPPYVRSVWAVPTRIR